MADIPQMDLGLQWQTQQQQLPGLLQMAQGGGGDGGVGFGGGGFGGAEPEPNFPTNWQNDPAFFTWQDRGKEYQAAEDASLASGGADQTAINFLSSAQRPNMAYMQGAELPSTNDWQKLPRAYRSPGYALQNGRIVDTAMASNPRRYLESLGVVGDPGQYKMSPGVGIGVPLSLNDLSIGGQRGVWPGDVRGRESFSTPSFATT